MDKQNTNSVIQLATNTADIDHIKKNIDRLEYTFEKFMERMEEKIDDMNTNMNKKFNEMEVKIDSIVKKQISLESKMKGGWLVICALGAVLVSIVSFFNTLHDIFTR